MMVMLFIRSKLLNLLAFGGFGAANSQYYSQSDCGYSFNCMDVEKGVADSGVDENGNLLNPIIDDYDSSLNCFQQEPPYEPWNCGNNFPFESPYLFAPEEDVSAFEEQLEEKLKRQSLSTPTRYENLKITSTLVPPSLTTRKKYDDSFYAFVLKKPTSITELKEWNSGSFSKHFGGIHGFFNPRNGELKVSESTEYPSYGNHSYPINGKGGASCYLKAKATTSIPKLHKQRIRGLFPKHLATDDETGLKKIQEEGDICCGYSADHDGAVGNLQKLSQLNMKQQFKRYLKMMMA